MKILHLLLSIIFLSFCHLSFAQHFDFNYPDRSSLLDAGWDFNAWTRDDEPRNTEQVEGLVISYDQTAHPGVIRIPADEGGFWENENNSRNTLFYTLPDDWTSIRLKIASFDPLNDTEAAGLMAYADDDNYFMIIRTYHEGNEINVEAEVNGDGTIINNSIQETATTDLYFRIDREAGINALNAYYSLDGINWIFAGGRIQSLIDPRIAIFVGGAQNSTRPVADIEWAEIITDPLSPVTDILSVHPGSLVFNATEGQPMIETRSLFISTTLGRTVSWNGSDDAAWLTTDITTGYTEGILRVGVNTSGLAAGTHTGNITILSTQVTGGSVTIPVTLIVNPNVPVKPATWKDGKAGALSVSIDDGQPSGFTELKNNGFQGTYVYNGVNPPSYYTEFYNAGMELGSHLNYHTCGSASNDYLRDVQIEPNIEGLCDGTPQPCEDVITLIWPCGYTSYREQAVASEYFLGARGYNLNELEDATPENFMNLKSFNSHGDWVLEPPVDDFKTLVDAAVADRKWFNLVLHELTNDDGAINYAATQDVWVSSIGNVVKYIMQRERFILRDYFTTDDTVRFNVTRSEVASSVYRSFESAFGASDSTTLEIDIDDTRLVERVLVNDLATHYQIVNVEGNLILRMNVRLEHSSVKTVRIVFFSNTVPLILLDTDVLDFVTNAGDGTTSQSVDLTSNLPGSVTWTVTPDESDPEWLSVSPSSGSGNGTLQVTVNNSGLARGTYSKLITITSPEAENSPLTITVNLTVNAPVLSVSQPYINLKAILNSPAPPARSINISNTGTTESLNWTSSEELSWLGVTPGGTTPGVMTLTVNQAGLTAGTYNGVITVSSDNIFVSPQTIPVTLTVYNGDSIRYDMTYTNRESLFADGWNFIAGTASGDPRNTEQTAGAVVSYDQDTHPGVLRIPVTDGDLWGETNTSDNTLFLDLPTGWTSIRLMISSFNPTIEYQQAGLVIYQDDDNYVQISRILHNRQYMVMAHESAGTPGIITFLNENATVNLHFRLDYYSATNTVAAYYSTDGTNWQFTGTINQMLNNPRLAIFTGSSPVGSYPNAEIAWVEVSMHPLPALTESITVQPGSLVLNAVEGQSANTRPLFISTTLDRTITWTSSISVDAPWLTTNIITGTTEGRLNVGANTTGLVAGTYTGNITISSDQVTGGPVTIPITLIVNPNVPVKAATWKDDRAGAMSVSVDDGQQSGYAELLNNGFQGTFVYNGTNPPVYYTEMYNNGMELGAHLTNHLYYLHPDNEIFRTEEIVPNINGICWYIPDACDDVISLSWPYGATNYRLQSVADDYFLGARGYNINQLEDASPENFMNLKSFNSNGDPEMLPTADFITLVDSAVHTKKWFNMVLHSLTNDDGAINYSASQDIWVSSIGNVVKYIMQRERFILSDYVAGTDAITFNASRLAIPASIRRPFETAFGIGDSITLLIDIDDDRVVENVLVNDTENPYRTKIVGSNRVLLTNILLKPSVEKTIEVRYSSATTVEQTITYSGGWNIFSLRVQPENTDMLAIVQPLIDAGVLVKVQDESGAAIENLPILGWRNNIGNWQPTKGYRIRVTGDTELNITGTPLAGPYTINLQPEWNIISYPYDVPQSALDAVNDLIVSGHLIKVQDESGAAIENLPVMGWVDNIVTLDPGKGYKIRMNAVDQITLTAPSEEALTGMLLKSASSFNSSINGGHFSTVWKGNGYDHMNIYVKKAVINNMPLIAGDEIAVFDGDICVGKAVISNANDIVMIAASKDDPITKIKDGFTEGNQLSFKIWSSGIERELKAGEVLFSFGYPDTYESMGTTLVNFSATESREVGFNNDVSVTIYPNPFYSKVTIAVDVNNETDFTFEVYSSTGQRITSDLIHALAGRNLWLWNGKSLNGEQVVPGLYTVKITSTSLLYNKAFQLIKY